MLSIGAAPVDSGCWNKNLAELMSIDTDSSPFILKPNRKAEKNHPDNLAANWQMH